MSDKPMTVTEIEARIAEWETLVAPKLAVLQRLINEGFLQPIINQTVAIIHRERTRL